MSKLLEKVQMLEKAVLFFRRDCGHLGVILLCCGQKLCAKLYDAIWNDSP